jgi:hypothetical protein
VKASDIALRAVLGLVALSNIFIGFLGVIPAIPVSKIASIFYSALLMVTPQLEHVTQMFGAYMLTIGILAALAILDPLRNRFIIYGVVFMLFLRTIQRILFASQAALVFDIPAGIYWAQTVIYFAAAVALIFLRPKVARSEAIDETKG